MSNLRIRVLLVAALLSGIASIAESSDFRSMRFTHMDRSDGLSQSFVYAIVQDPQGYMWIGTQEGLNRFDGYEFRVFSHEPGDSTSISDDSISAMLVDRRGRLWVATDVGGLSLYDPVTETFKNYLHDPADQSSISDNRVRTIYEDSAGKLWIGTDGSGVDRFDPVTGSFEHFPHDPLDPRSLAGANVWSILQQSDGTLWFGTNNGLSRFDPDTGSFTNSRSDVDDSSSLNDNFIRVLFEDRRGSLWLGTEMGGLNTLDTSTGQFAHFEHDPSDDSSISADRINAIYEDNEGEIWIATPRGLNAWNAESRSFSRYVHDPLDPYSIANDTVMSIFQDRGGVLWVGTYDGLCLWNRSIRAMGHYKRHSGDANSLSLDTISSFAENSDGNIWVGTFGGGLNLLDTKTNRFKQFRHDPEDESSISSDEVMAVLVDQEGVLWAGTRSAGLNRFDSATGKFARFFRDKNDSYSQSSNGVTFMLEDSSGDGIWIATFGGGLHYFKKRSGELVVYRHDPDDPQSLSNDRVLALYEDSQRNLWIGTYGGGLNRLDRKSERFEHFVAEPGRDDSLSGNEIYVIVEDAIGNLWISAQGGGLSRWDRSDRERGIASFKHFGEIDGLPHSTIYSALWGDSGHLWMSTGHGLSRFDTRTMEFRNYDTSHGLQGDEFNFAAGLKAADGRIYFGGLNGFNAFHPELLTSSTHAPAVVISKFSSLNEPVDLSEFRRSNTPLELNYKEYFLEFEFAALDFAAPENNRYMFKLEGLDRDWVDAGTKRRVSYTNLPAGDYTFRVKAISSDGVVSDKEATLRLHMAPAPWKSAWAYLAYLLILVLLIAALIGASRRRVRQDATRRYAEELEAVEARLNAAQKIGRIGNWELDMESGSCWWSHELYRLLDLAPGSAEPSLELFLDRVYPDDREAAAKKINESIETATPFVMELRMVASGNSTRLFKCRGEVVQDADGGASLLSGTVSDITERKKAEDEIRHHGEFQELLANLSSSLIQGSPGEIEKQIHKGLRITGTYYGLDAVSIWWLTEDKQSVRPEYRWSRIDERLLADEYNAGRFPWIASMLGTGKPLAIDDLQALPLSAKQDQKSIMQKPAKSLVIVPILVGGVAMGGCAFLSYEKKRHWDSQIKAEFALVAESLGGALSRLRSIIQIEKLKERLQEENYYLRGEAMLAHNFDEIVGEDRALRTCLKLVEKVAPTDAPVLILGESGTGKELIARAIHKLSARRDRPMIGVNCPALAATLIESELFGHEEGAFTGATSKRPGRFELAEGGTLFLDEIGELSMELQAKLLRVLQSGEFERLGGTKTRVANVRIIAATNRDLKRAIRQSEFREDLYYRISSFPILLPPLRERKEDIPLLAEHFVRKHSGRLNKTITAISSRTISELVEYEWPGNVRELESIIVRSLISAGDNSVLLLPEPLGSEPGTAQNGNGSAVHGDYEDRAHLVAVLEMSGWRISGPHGAAARLGVPPSTLRSRMKRLGIERQES